MQKTLLFVIIGVAFAWWLISVVLATDAFNIKKWLRRRNHSKRH